MRRSLAYPASVPSTRLALYVLSVCLLAVMLSSCATPKESIQADSPPVPRPITTLLDQPLNIGFDQVFMTYVGRGVIPNEFRRPLEIKEPAEVRCQVSYQKLLLGGPPPPGAVAVNVIVSGKGFGVNCQESLFESTFRKEVVCRVAERGELDLRIQSANPVLTIAVGFICTRNKLEAAALAPLTTPQLKVRSSGIGSTPTASPGGLAAGPVLSRKLVSTSDGKDDKHKVLTLSPCSDPLWSNGVKGTAIIGKNRRVSFMVVDSSNCDIEVSGVADGLLESDSNIKLLPRAH